MKKFLISILYLAAICLTFSCTVSSTKVKDPVLKTTPSVLSDNLQNVFSNEHISCKKVDIDGTETTTGNQVTTAIAIRLINGQNIPNDADKETELCKKIAKTMKMALQDPNEYDTYKVVFVTKSSKGGLTTTHSESHAFKKDEL